MNLCALVRLMTSMQDRDLSDLSPMLYACGFPCKPCLVSINHNHSVINPLLPSPTYFLVRELSEVFAVAPRFEAYARSGSSAVLGQSGGNFEEILECDYTIIQCIPKHPTVIISLPCNLNMCRTAPLVAILENVYGILDVVEKVRNLVLEKVCSYRIPNTWSLWTDISSALTAALRSGKRCTKSGSATGFASSRLMVATSEIQLHVAECISFWSGGHQNISNQHEKQLCMLCFQRQIKSKLIPHGSSWFKFNTLCTMQGCFWRLHHVPPQAWRTLHSNVWKAQSWPSSNTCTAPYSIYHSTWDFKPTLYFPTTALSLPISPRSTLLLPRDCEYLRKVNKEIGEKVRKRKVCEDDYYDLIQEQLNWTRISWEVFAFGTYIDLALPA